MIVFPEGAHEHFDIEGARHFLESPVPDGYRRWVCVLCSCPAGDFKKEFEHVGAYCCGGCGMSCVRPLDEHPRLYADAHVKP